MSVHIMIRTNIGDSIHRKRFVDSTISKEEKRCHISRLCEYFEFDPESRMYKKLTSGMEVRSQA